MPTSPETPLPDGRGFAHIDSLKARILESEFGLSVSRSGGPGGQNVNKVNTRVSITLDLPACRGLTEDEKRRVSGKLGSRVSTAGEIRVTSSRFRTQLQNREAAVERLYQLLAMALTPERHRRRTKVPRSQRKRRLEGKRLLSSKKAQRRGSGQEL